MYDRRMSEAKALLVLKDELKAAQDELREYEEFESDERLIHELKKELVWSYVAEQQEKVSPYPLNVLRNFLTISL